MFYKKKYNDYVLFVRIICDLLCDFKELNKKKIYFFDYILI